jgi:inward rectifier potassium channel
VRRAPEKRRDSVYLPGRTVVTRGLRRSALSDLYHVLLTSPWWQLLSMLAAIYVGVNVLFALAYLGLGDVIEHARPGSFADAFFFSVQTMATVGYGNFWPRTMAANLLATAEMIAGGMGLALMTGLVFAKFARPTARVLFSDVAVVRSWQGAPSLQFRMANARSSQIVEAHVSVLLLRTERSAEGEELRRMHDLRLVRANSALFALTWTAIHPIDEHSPLRGEDPASLERSSASVIVSFSGWDENLAATVHARHTYGAEAIRFGRRFVDVISDLPGGERVVDYARFHDTAPEVEPPRAGA